jgi:hypothetical protein
MKIFFVLNVLTLSFLACNTSVSNQEEKYVNDVQVSKGDSIIELAYEAHGGTNYRNTTYAFDFRGVTYSFLFTKDNYRYTKKDTTKGKLLTDKMTSDGFERTINSKVEQLSEIEKHKYSESLNSVIYFASLPYKLRDKAVNRDYQDDTNINGENYFTVKISFDEKGGGTDHDDVFYYWINKQTHTIDYLAYQYATNGGGVRFRKAFNARRVNNVVFQDYVNFGAPVGTDLKDLPGLFERNELEELSRILSENVRVI